MDGGFTFEAHETAEADYSHSVSVSKEFESEGLTEMTVNPKSHFIGTLTYEYYEILATVYPSETR